MRVYGCMEKSFTVSVFHCIISWASIAHTPHCQLLRALTSIPQLRPWHQLVAPAPTDPNPRQKSQNRALDIALLAHAKPHEFSKGLLFFCQLLQICFNCLFHFHSVATRPFVFPAEHGTCCVGFFLHLPHPQRFSCASRVSFSLFFRPSRFRVLFAIREAALLLAPKSPKIWFLWKPKGNWILPNFCNYMVLLFLVIFDTIKQNICEVLEITNIGFYSYSYNIDGKFYT